MGKVGLTALAALLTPALSVASAASGDQLMREGRFPEAAAAYEACIDAANQNGRADHAARCLLGQGAARILSGELSLAETNLNQALQLSRQQGDVPGQRSALLARGKLATYQARFNQADERFDEALALAGDSPYDQTRAWLGKAENAVERLDRPGFRAYLAEAHAGSREITDGATRRPLQLAAGEVALRSNARMKLANRDLNSITRSLAETLDDAGQAGDNRTVSHASGLLGEFYLLAERGTDALRLARVATFQAQQLESPELAYRWEWLLGRSLRASGQWDEAAIAMERALVELSGIRSGLLTGIRGRRQPFRELVGPLFQDHADVLLTQASTAPPPRAQVLRNRARNVIEAFKSAELEDYFLDECVVDLRQKEVALDQLDPGTAVLYPILLKDRTELLLSIGDTIHQFTVQATDEQIARMAVQFRRALERRNSHRYKMQASRLYDWLLRPAEDLLADAGIDTLVFVPDGALRNVPLAAFYDGRQFVIEKFAVATTPGLNLTDPRPIPRDDTRFLVNGLTEAVQGFPALPSVEAELESLESLFAADAITLLKNQSFLVSNIEQEITQRPYNVVHFASHGEFQADVSESFLLTYNERLTMDQLDDFMQLRRFSDDPVELLTLSACKTAAGDDRAALGLAGIAIRAGARSAMGTLWYINDRATSELITDFYGHLRDPGNSKARALQLAQLEMFSDRRYAHPGYWAPFLLIGNWL